MTVSRKKLIRLLVDYCLDGKELRDYEDWCTENNRNPDNYADNTEHIYAVAVLVRGKGR